MSSLQRDIVSREESFERFFRSLLRMVGSLIGQCRLALKCSNGNKQIPLSADEPVLRFL